MTLPSYALFEKIFKFHTACHQSKSGVLDPIYKGLNQGHVRGDSLVSQTKTRRAAGRGLASPADAGGWLRALSVGWRRWRPTRARLGVRARSLAAAPAGLRTGDALSRLGGCFVYFLQYRPSGRYWEDTRPRRHQESIST